MTQQEITDRFTQILRNSLEDGTIHPLYYGLAYWEHTEHYLEMINGNAEDPLHRYLQRYHERVFCYELYFRLRSLMEAERDQDNQEVYQRQHIFLQSEVRKMQIHEVIEVANEVMALSAEYMPDFLLHTPGNFENQLVVMEVKSNPRLSFDMIRADLFKIQEFITRYRYEKGIFLAVNLGDERKAELLPAIADWAAQNIVTPEQITVLIKDRPDSPVQEFTLENIPLNQ